MYKLLALGDNRTLQEIKNLLTTPTFLFNPLLIEPLEFEQPLKTSPHKIIVISPNAANFGFKKIAAQLSKETQVFSIGESTAQTLREFWPHPILHPENFTSEALLALPDLQQIQDQTILILKGKEGRMALEKTLGERRAIVYTVDCYQRMPGNLDLTEPLKIWQNNGVNVLLVSSAESLAAFCQAMPETATHWLHDLTLAVTSERLETIAHSKGFSKVKRAKNFTADDVLDLLRNLEL